MVATRNITDLNALTVPAADDILLIVDRLSATSTEAKKITWANVQEAIQDIVGALATDTTTLNFTYDDANGTLTAAVNNNTSIQKSIFHDGTTSSTRQEARFVDGIGVNVEVADDSVNDRANVTVKNTGVVNANNNVVAGTSYNLLSSVNVEADGSKTLEMRPIKLGSNKLSGTLTDSNQSLTIDINASNIDINDLSTATPLSVSTGGTGASTASVARNNLGAAKSGSNSDISSLSGLSTALSISQGGTGDSTASGALQNLQGLNSVAGVGASGEQLVYQSTTLVSGAYRAELKGLKPTSDNYITVVTDGSDLALGANPNNILDGVSGARNVNGARITNAGTPINSNDLATKSYVDAQTTGLDVKGSVQAATTANLSGTYSGSAKTLTASGNGAISIDGISLNLNDRVLVKDQTDQTQNGIYSVTTLGDGSTAYVLTRAVDFDTSAEVSAGAFSFTEAGTANNGKSFVQTTQNPVLDTSNLVFSVFGETGVGVNSLANDKLQQTTQATVKGRAAGVGTGNVSDLSADQLIGVLNAASSATLNAARVSDPATADTNSRVAVFNGSDVSATGTRRAVRFIAGSNVTISMTDDSANEEVEVTIASTASGGGGASLGLAIALG